MCVMDILVVEEDLVSPGELGRVVLLVISIVVMMILAMMIQTTKIPELMVMSMEMTIMILISSMKDHLATMLFW